MLITFLYINYSAMWMTPQFNHLILGLPMLSN